MNREKDEYEGKLEYFMKRTAQDFAALHQSIAKLDHKTDQLFKFKWTSGGVILGINTLLSAFVSALTLYFIMKPR
jgi:hypothetical protein